MLPPRLVGPAERRPAAARTRLVVVLLPLLPVTPTARAACSAIHSAVPPVTGDPAAVAARRPTGGSALTAGERTTTSAAEQCLASAPSPVTSGPGRQVRRPLGHRRVGLAVDPGPARQPGRAPTRRSRGPRRRPPGRYPTPRPGGRPGQLRRTPSSSAVGSTCRNRAGPGRPARGEQLDPAACASGQPPVGYRRRDRGQHRRVGPGARLVAAAARRSATPRPRPRTRTACAASMPSSSR